MMKFREITEKEYEKFWEKSEQQSFLSAPALGKMDVAAEIYYVGVFEGEKLVAAGMLKGNKRHFGWKSFYAPRGLLVDYGNQKLVDFFAKKLKMFLKQKNGYLLKIDPYVELVERDIDGKVVEGGYNHKNYSENLQKSGFLRAKYVHNVSQIEWMFVTELLDENIQSVQKKMKNATKRAIKHAEEWGIQVRKLDRGELRKFYEVERQTAERRGFGMREIEYYERLYDLYGENVAFMVAELNPKLCFEKIQRKYDEAVRLRDEGRKNQELMNEILSLEGRIAKLQGIFGEPKDEEIVLSAGVFMITKREIVYFVGGNVEKYMKLGGQYLIQWQMMKLAMEKGCERYNFYGIVPDIEQHPENYGVYEFKKGFSGKVVQLIGEYELIVDKKRYWLMKILGFMKRFL